MARGSRIQMIKMHLSLRVKNVARSVAFYEALFGAPAHKLRPGYANFDLSHPPLKLALVEHPAVMPRGGALDHLGFQVGSAAEVEAFKRRLIAAGLATFDEKDATCCYAKQDKIWAHDPDGNEWEVYVLLDDLQDDHAHDHAGIPLSGEAPKRSPLTIQPAHRCCDT